MMVAFSETIDFALCDCHEGLSSSKIEMSELVGTHLRNDPHYRLSSIEELLGLGTNVAQKPPRRCAVGHVISWPHRRATSIA